MTAPKPTEIKDALRELMDAIAGKGTDRLPVLLDQVDQYVREHASSLAPELRHYLERRSYQKALVWLQEHAAEKR